MELEEIKRENFDRSLAKCQSVNIFLPINKLCYMVVKLQFCQNGIMRKSREERLTKEHIAMNAHLT